LTPPRSTRMALPSGWYKRYEIEP